MCEKSVRRLMQLYDNLKDYKYLIVTGGTGESRFAQIKDMLSGLPHLTVLPGNVNTPDLSFTYSNVIGYYMFRYANLKKSIAQSA
jgi:plasmid segregation protein ParM